MKKLIAIAAIAVFALPLCAATASSDMVTVDDVADDLSVDEDNGLEVKVDAPRKNVALWPAFIAIWDFPETPDLVGLRITVPYSTKQENVTGVDFGLWGRSEYFEGVQFNVQTKGEMYGLMRRRFEERSVRIPVDRELREDLHAVQRVVSTGGNVTYSAPRNADGHSDRAAALALCCRAASSAPYVPPIIATAARNPDTRSVYGD